MKIIELERTISTNTFAAKLDTQPELPFIVRANFQEKGRGQGDHNWESEPNMNLLFSIVFIPSLYFPNALNASIFFRTKLYSSV